MTTRPMLRWRSKAWLLVALVVAGASSGGCDGADGSPASDGGSLSDAGAAGASDAGAAGASGAAGTASGGGGEVGAAGKGGGGEGGEPGAGRGGEGGAAGDGGASGNDCEGEQAGAHDGCKCPAGFAGDGQTCSDIDECSLGIAGCDEHATCANTQGAFVCTCDEGLVGDGFSCREPIACTPEDDPSECGEHASCRELGGGGPHVCLCDAGYAGDGLSCEDVDECDNGTAGCHTDAQCTNTDGSFECACDDGFTGDGFECNDVDECDQGTHGCDAPRATCVNTAGSFECECLSGYAGDACAECAPGHQDHDQDGVCAPDCATAALDCGAHRACDDGSGAAVCVYERQVPIHNPGAALDDFQVRLVFDSGRAIAQGHMLETCDDLRFFEQDGRTAVPHWLEGGCGGATTVWLRVSHLAAASTHTLVMRYRGTAAESRSDGEAVFEIFDDFSTDSEASYTLHSHESWPGSFIWNEQESRLMTDTSNRDIFLTRDDSAEFAEDHWVEIRSYSGDNDGTAAVLRTSEGELYACVVTNDYAGASSIGTSERLVHYDSLPTSLNQASALRSFGNVASAHNAWAVTGLAYSAGKLMCSYDGVVQGSSYNAGDLPATSLGLASMANVPAALFDWLRVRKFAPTPPGAVVDECAVDNGGCDPTATCANVPGGVTCMCPTGYESHDGGQTCVDIDECAGDACDDLTECTNTAGSFECGPCPAGYSGTGATGCEDIDECAQDNGGCHANATCTNLDGGRTCACNQGYSGDGVTCTDIDECLTGADTCDPSASCVNTTGSYTCECPTGYQGDGNVCVPTGTIRLYNHGRQGRIVYDSSTPYHINFNATGHNIEFQPTGVANRYYIKLTTTGGTNYRWCWVSDSGFRNIFRSSSHADYDTNRCQYTVSRASTDGQYRFRNVYLGSLEPGYSYVKCASYFDCTFLYMQAPASISNWSFETP